MFSSISYIVYGGESEKMDTMAFNNDFYKLKSLNLQNPPQTIYITLKVNFIALCKHETDRKTNRRNCRC